ncbi:MAG: hypothetical protein HRU09_10425 [Oligoflexales bacterium]|nr:hypothetical protein [Oligoflexales bacterium]
METQFPSGAPKVVARYDDVRHRLTKKIHHQLITSCVLFPDKKEDEYVYVGDVVKRLSGWFVFWRKRKDLSTREKLIGTLLK